MDLFIYNRSDQKDWWRRYSVRLGDGKTLHVRPGQGYWVRAVPAPREITVRASAIHTSTKLEFQVGKKQAIEIMGHARHLIATPREIDIQLKAASISDLNVPDWRAEGYRLPSMIAGFVAYYAICLVWLAFVIGTVILKGSEVLFLLIAAVPPVYLMTILTRLANNAVVSSRTVSELRSENSDLVRSPVGGSRGYFSILFVMIVVFGFYFVSTRLHLPSLANIFIFGTSFVAVVFLARRLRPQRPSK